jgi:hypothetical protein
MVRAILNYQKSQTRRVVKPQPKKHHLLEGFFEAEDLYMHGWYQGIGKKVILPGFKLKCPYQIGDHLWVRETWALIDDTEFGGICYVQYKADRPNEKYPGDWPADEAKGNPDAPKWKPSIFMPKKYARIWLEVTNVRVERVQDISRNDAMSEGIPQTYGEAVTQFSEKVLKNRCNHIWDNHASVENFQWLWDSINGKKYPWKSNPWVWVYDFKVIEK